MKLTLFYFLYRHLRCKNHEICPGTAKIDCEILDTIHDVTQHDTAVCTPDPNLENITRFKTEIQAAVQRTRYRPLKEIYDEFAAM